MSGDKSTSTVTSPVELPGSLQTNRRLSQWLTFHADGRVTVRTGKVDLGQGISTVLAQIVAEELDIDLGRIRVERASTVQGPNEGMTAGSMSVQHSGSALRQACAEAREIYLNLAARQHGLTPVQCDGLRVRDGEFITNTQDSGDRSIGNYWHLADDALLDVDANGQAKPKGLVEHSLTGQSVPRLDLPGKVLGQADFIHDMVLPGQLYGRVAHPPSPGAVLLEVALDSINALPGVVTTVRDGSFIGVIARTDHAAVQALKKLAAAARWHEPATLPDMHALPEFLRSQPVDSKLYGEKKSDTPGPSLASSEGSRAAAGAQYFKASYARPFLAHASIGPSCALARCTANASGRITGVEVWTHSQGIYNLLPDLALMLDLPAAQIALQHVPGAGCYGHNGADDAACDAVLLARAVPGLPVQLQWTREDELSCAPFGAAMAVDLQAVVDADGCISDWQHDIWSNGHSMRPGRSSSPVFYAAALLEKPFPRQVAINMPLASGGGAERNSLPSYDFAQWRTDCHRALTMPLRTSSLRSLGAHCNVFAVESFLDEIADKLGVDPLAFRLRHLSDERSRAVLNAAAAMADWPNRHGGERPEGTGMGIAFARYKNTGAYCAVVAAVHVEAEVRVEQLWIATDVGLAVNPDGVRNQIEGGAIQTVSWVLKEAVQFDRTRVTSRSWEDYPILRFSEVPKVDVQLVSRPGDKSLGAGEATHGPVAAAIANAVADALGLRMRQMPLSADALLQAALADPP
jgi:CO/xanthine dehydrogenase Mo-binding subunit